MDRDTARLQTMLDSVRHRGPDDSGIFLSQEDRLALGFNRLSIIDLSAAGHQPMVNPRNGDVLCFNGEIYNFRQLRRSLELGGASFRGSSDSEVLLLAFERWGIACLDKIKGMYAFAIWRPDERALYLVRDPMGIKPLYYQPSNGTGVTFASEVRGLLAIADGRLSLDSMAVKQFLEFGYTFENERTILSGVKKVPPGHYLHIVQGSGPTLHRHFAPEIVSKATRDVADLEEELYVILTEVVGQHLVADVPVGLLLSGGLDSSIIAAIASRSTSVRTFTMGFGESALDERPNARLVAEQLGSPHEEILVSPTTVKSGLEETIACFDDLFADWGTISTRLLYRECRDRGIKVALVGEGADELFGGYDIFQASRSRAPTDLWLFQLYRLYAGRRYGRTFGAFRSIMREHLRQVDGDRFDAIRLFETRQQLPNNYVMKVDKASMAVGVEARVPFLDQRVAEFSYRCSAEMLLSGGKEKKLLRGMAQRFKLLPAAVFNRPKRGGSIAASWMDDHAEFRLYAEEILLARGTWTESLGLRPAMYDYFRHRRSGYRFPRSISIFRNLAWRLLILELWTSFFRIGAHAH